MWLYHRVMSPNDADGMANSVVPDQTVLSLQFLPRHICLENLGLLQYKLSEYTTSRANDNVTWTVQDHIYYCALVLAR